ncbi:hypothetical protein NDU88_000894 [Pleurodeles waltl]|uniref:Uncharacterized protein n=1 Tax=Pleurodeles waltl TaxID=8319 RepID=A0AAV7KNZ1_PLEWA|nr:hypothetical protein NDU88_000894 [Pleurodeles waltl]
MRGACAVAGDCSQRVGPSHSASGPETFPHVRWADLLSVCHNANSYSQELRRHTSDNVSALCWQQQLSPLLLCSHSTYQGGMGHILVQALP